MKTISPESTLRRRSPGAMPTAQEKTMVTEPYEYKETLELVQLVKDAAELIRLKGEAAFADFRLPGSPWRQDVTYIFVLDPKGNMLVHSDAAMEGKNELDLKDINGKPIVRGLIGAATTFTSKPEGWYHYQWPVPGGLLPRWKSAYVRLVAASSGARYIVGSGMYNDRMEKSFVLDLVENAVGQIEKSGEAAFPLFYDPTGPFIAKDAYIFVFDMNGIELVNPAFPNLVGRNLLDVNDTQGKQLIREMVQVAQTRGSGWVDYMWPKPGESISTQKSAYVSKAKLGDKSVVVGCGVYLADAPQSLSTTRKMTAEELVALVRDAAVVFEQRGEKAFPDFRKKGSRWFRDDTYFFVQTLDGSRLFNAADPATEGMDVSDVKDVLGRPITKMILKAASNPNGEGWLHYMWPEPGNIFPAWKSTFAKRVTFPSGKQRVIGCGIYNMDMDKTFIEDLVNRAADLVAARGKEAFGELRDKKGSFVFMDTYVFVETTDGTSLVNPGQLSFEGKNLLALKDLNGRFPVRDCIDAAMKDGTAWLEYYWYRPGQNTPAYKHTYVRNVQFGKDTYIVGAGFYPAEQKITDIQKLSWASIEKERLSDSLSRQALYGQNGTLAQFFAKRGVSLGRHSHVNEEYLSISSGALNFIFDDRDVEVHAGEVLVIPPNIPHSVVALEDSVFFEFFAPVREDWLRGEDQYLRG